MTFNVRLLDTRVRHVVMKQHRQDSLCADINPNLTFRDLLIALLVKDNVYTLLGVDDSVIREYAFQALADILGCDYSVPYELWLDD